MLMCPASKSVFLMFRRTPFANVTSSMSRSSTCLRCVTFAGRPEIGVAPHSRLLHDRRGDGNGVRLLVGGGNGRGGIAGDLDIAGDHDVAALRGKCGGERVEAILGRDFIKRGLQQREVGLGRGEHVPVDDALRDLGGEGGRAARAGGLHGLLKRVEFIGDGFLQLGIRETMLLGRAAIPARPRRARHSTARVCW